MQSEYCYHCQVGAIAQAHEISISIVSAKRPIDRQQPAVIEL